MLLAGTLTNRKEDLSNPQMSFSAANKRMTGTRQSTYMYLQNGDLDLSVSIPKS